MPTPKNRRWTCPSGAHPGVVAPARLRKVDVRRFCWPCSTAAGILVERSCAANEASSTRAKARANRKTATKRNAASRKKEAAAALVRSRSECDGITIAQELDRLWAHARKLCGSSLAPNPPRLSVQLRKSAPGTSGWARYVPRRIHLGIGTQCDRIRLCGVLAHEVAHHMARGEHHSEVYWTTLDELTESAYGTKRGPGSETTMWDKQCAVEAALADCTWLVAGEPAPRKPAIGRLLRVAAPRPRVASLPGKESTRGA